MQLWVTRIKNWARHVAKADNGADLKQHWMPHFSSKWTLTMQTRKSFIALSAAENVTWSQRQGLTDKVSITTAKVGWVHQAASDKLNEMEKRWSAKPSNAAETPPPLPHQAYYSQSLCRFVFFTELSLVTNVTDEQKVHRFTLLLVFTSFGTRERAVRRKSDTLCLLHSQTLCCRYKRDGFIFMFRI